MKDALAGSTFKWALFAAAGATGWWLVTLPSASGTGAAPGPTAQPTAEIAADGGLPSDRSAVLVTHSILGTTTTSIPVETFAGDSSPAPPPLLRTTAPGFAGGDRGRVPANPRDPHQAYVARAYVSVTAVEAVWRSRRVVRRVDGERLRDVRRAVHVAPIAPHVALRSGSFGVARRH